MILGRDLLAAFVLSLKLSESIIAGGDRPYEVCTPPMVNIGTYEYKPLNVKDRIKIEE